MFAKKILASGGTLALAAGLSAGFAGTASASTPDGHAIIRTSDQPVEGGGGVWADASYVQFASLDLVSSVVTPPVVSPAAAGYTTFTYSLNVREDGSFRAIPGSLTPNQFFPGSRIRGEASGNLSGYATYRFTDVVPSTTAVDPAIASALTVIDLGLATTPVSDSTVYTASGVRWTYARGYVKTLAPGYWKHFAAVRASRHHKAHKAYSKWIPAKTVFIPGRWVSHRFTQSWTDASWNHTGQSRWAGNITGFFGLYR